MWDCIVVGFGIAGMSVTAHLEAKGKKVFVVDADYKKASIVAAGIYNPVILKRFSMAWNADEQLVYAKNFYNSLEARFSKKIDYDLPVLRRFNSVDEQNTWFSKLNNPTLNKYMSDELVCSPANAILTPFKCGKVEGTGRILVKDMEDSYVSYLSDKKAYLKEVFDYSKLIINEDFISYKEVDSKAIIFCEGYSLNKNPFFNYLPLITSKGCYLVFECSSLQLKTVLKSHFFLIPLGGDKYKFGATYEHQFKNKDHDVAAKNHLIDELEKIISEPYKLLFLQIGIRPTVIDRRPLVGQHDEHKSIYICNGMGTRGIMIAPTAANSLVNFIIESKPIPIEMNITRFEK